MTTVIDTVAWIELRAGRILGARTRGNRWFYIPGGKRHAGESDVETLVREAEEELTVTLLPATARHVGTYEAAADEGSAVRVTMACYTADHRGKPRASGEIEEVAWLSYADRLRTPPVDRLVFDDLRAAGLLD
ncbi:MULTISPECIES: NUDIX hydrolase [unclassified Streptomyces]|uniref:NUDIX hydrolase n=1 Tax=unclassified Streptomyces TaxID=2593676 RepID=UPI0022B6D46F|nr:MULTISPECIES: NUDIX domain-containing protein [unclassified Streptomyces]MCZ7415636.1 NUDIX domain-containing protein [Streptomyces sp. WMMC897]MCZ7434552.1 NUDIX domain-containing protein [Streptomyces sp. WMMC1477]